MPDFTENDLREIERDRDLPPDEPHPRPEPDEDDSAPENPRSDTP